MLYAAMLPMKFCCATLNVGLPTGPYAFKKKSWMGSLESGYFLLMT